MKILQINSTCNWGSTGRIAEDIGTLVMEQGWTSIVAYGRTFNHSKSETIRIGNKFDVYSHVIFSRILDNHGLMSKAVTRKFIKDIDKINPDIIHLHNIHGYYINYEILFNYLVEIKKPVVWTLHDCWSFTGHCAHFTSGECNKWQVECSDCSLLKSYPASLFLDNSKNNFHKKRSIFNKVENLTIVSVSNWLNNLAKESFLKGNECISIYNGIDTDVFRPLNSLAIVRERYSIKGKNFVLGVASVWDSRKGLDDFKKLRDVLHKDIDIVLVGLTQKQIELLPNGIIGITRTNVVEELCELYSAADITLNLSYQETFGLTTVEGMACGIPGIVYNCTASPELVSSDTGIIVEPGDIEGVNKAINIILSNGKEYYLNACCQRVISKFEKINKYNDYINLYNKLLNK